jgi:hypothetical protein
MGNDIVGAIDNSSLFSRFGGWAKSANRAVHRPIKVCAYYGTRMVASCDADLFRNDMRQHCGFELSLNIDVDADDVKSGAFTVRAEYESSEAKVLQFFPKALEAFEMRCLGRKLASTSDYDIKQLLVGLTHKTDKQLLKMVAQSVDRFAQSGTSAYIGESGSMDLSTFGLRVGLKSPDGSAVIGRDGTMFVLHGANSLLSQYAMKRTDASIIFAADNWVRLFAERRAMLADCGCQYLQLIIPEKSSVWPERFPVEIETPTALLRSVSDRVLQDTDLAACYIDCVEIMTRDADRLSIYRNVDSHLSTYGARLITLNILERLGQPTLLPTDRGRYEMIEGDLGAKFIASPMYEKLSVPEPRHFDSIAKGMKQVEFSSPAAGQHIGTRVRWTNETAPNSVTAVVFGNSFFERGMKPSELSWWGARCFRDFHFLWQPDVDYDYIKKVKADVVICQNIERFLPRVARS